MSEMMQAAWYEAQGPASEVLVVGELSIPLPLANEVRIRIHASGINPGDVKKRQNSFDIGMPYARVVPHSDGAGVIDAVGEGVSEALIGKRVWCFGAQTYRPFGTAAQFTTVPVRQTVLMPESMSFEQGACLGIPGITAHRAVYAAGDLKNKTVLVNGGAGAVGVCAVQLASRSGAKVIASCRKKQDVELIRSAGASEVFLSGEAFSANVKRVAPLGVNHIVEVAFSENIRGNLEILAQGGSVATYASTEESATIPFWPLIFGNHQLYFVGSDDVPIAAKEKAAHDINLAFKDGWGGFQIAHSFTLSEVAHAHECVEIPDKSGRVVLVL